ncbi:MAG TPA: TonB-dependent receptor [Gammaproteobacteria bacterium]|nr:TonB-dependent receptor [Gammaproteobacteria bacterium]
MHAYLDGRCWLALTITLLTGAVPAAESEQPDSDTASAVTAVALEAVTVSATRTERPLFDTPAAVTTLTADDIAERQPYGYEDLLDGVPGAAVQGGPRRIAEEPVIRGFRDEQVVIRVDGARQNFNQAHRGRFLLDPDLLAGVEVLRGSSSAVYGSGALGGVLTFVTRDAGDWLGERDGAGARLKLGHQTNGDELGYYLTVFGQSGAFDALASFVQRKLDEDLEDGQGTPISASRDELTNGFGKVGIDLGVSQRFTFTAERYENEGVNPANANDAANGGNLVDRTTRRDGARLNYRFDEPGNDWLALTAVVYRNEVNVAEHRLTDGRLDRTFFETNGFDIYNTTSLPFGQHARVTYGVEHYADEQSGTRNGVPRPQFPHAEARYRAFYMQAELPFGRRFLVLPGVRRDAFEFDSHGAFAVREDVEISPRLAVGFHATDDVYLWGGYARAFRAPSLTELYADGVHFVAPLGPGQVVINEFEPNPDLRPERARTRELGLRHRHGAWRIFATVFESDVEDFIEQQVIFISGPPVFDPSTGMLVYPGTTTVTNVDAELHGWEAEASWDPGVWFTTLALGRVFARDMAGEPLASTPPDRATLRAGARLFERRLVAGGQITWGAAREDVPAGTITTGSYRTLDLFLRWLPTDGALRGFEFTFGLDNALDENWRIHPSGVNQPGRSFRFTLGKTFGGIE